MLTRTLREGKFSSLFEQGKKVHYIRTGAQNSLGNMTMYNLCPEHRSEDKTA
jgi:hypothetical protein